jgi:hypothetical protein
MSAHLEQVFFYLGGMGYTNRGIYNDFAYCRPITKTGPIVTATSNGQGQCFVLDDLYNSKSVREFFYKYGGMTVGNPPGSKYVPIRYHWITLYPLLTYGTVEYRIFNKTMNPNYLYTIVKFCQLVSNEMLSGTKELPENSIFSPHDKGSVIRTLTSFINKFELDLNECEIKTLISIIERTPDIKLKQEYIYTHLARNGNHMSTIFGDGYCTPNIPMDKVKAPEIITIREFERNQNNPVLGQ